MKKFLGVIVVLVLALVAVGYFAPKDYEVRKQVTINASPQQIHAYVGDLEKWAQWTPWMESDPNMEIKSGSRTTGVGATQSWSGKDGDGELTFTMSDPEQGIAYDMAFIMEGNRVPASSQMMYEKKGAATEVTWVMTGSWKGAAPPIMDGLMSLMAPMMIGGDFDKGLTKLKLLVENA